MMNIEYIDAYVELMAESCRVGRKVDGLIAHSGTTFKTVDEFRKAATVTGSSIKRYQFDDAVLLVFTYRGHEFRHAANANEVTEVA